MSEESRRRFNEAVGGTSIRYYNRDGSVSTDPYATMQAWEAGHHVANTIVGRYWVSTIWLFVDHGWHSEAPLIFESMVFALEDDGSPDMGGVDMRRYGTEVDAVIGHGELVKELQAAQGGIEAITGMPGEPAMAGEAERSAGALGEDD